MNNDRRFPVANGAKSSRAFRVWFGLSALPALFAASLLVQTPVSAQEQPTSLQGKSQQTDALPPTPGKDDTAAPTEKDKAKVDSLAQPETLHDQGQQKERGELRGMWVVCDSLSTPKSVHQVVVTARKYHLNTLFVQVRSRGDAWYNSHLEPRAEGLSGQPRSFDPLAQIVEEGHANGLQIHAWLNTMLTWSRSRRPYNPHHLWNAHRDWFALDRNGHLSTADTEDCEGVFVQPSNPAVQQHLFEVFTDVAARYDVDGIHFDYVRYPNESYDFSSGTLSRFRAFLAPKLAPDKVARLDARRRSDPKVYVHAFGKEWALWRRAQVTDLVARISDAVKADKPWMQVSAAVFATVEVARDERGQDWVKWLRTGKLDAVALMSYGKDTQHVLAQTRRAVALAGDRHIYTGIGAWQLSAHDVAHKIAAVRKAGASGINLFSYDSVHDRSHYLDTLARGVFASRSAPPRMRWLPGRNGTYDRNAASKSTATKSPTADASKATTAKQAVGDAKPPNDGAK